MESALEKAREMARASVFDGARSLGKWHDVDVFEPTNSGDSCPCIGFPQFILHKAGILRWSSGEEEARAIMRQFYPPED